MKTHFYEQVEKKQVTWRNDNISVKEWARQGPYKREWILPSNEWKLGLWPSIRESLPEYLKKEEVQRHKGCHNLKSSWMLCANLYFPFRKDKDLLAGFLNKFVSDKIRTVDQIELEYAEEPPLDPHTLLGEPAKGKRGANQTSPDVAFIVNEGAGLILTENKYTEHSFYPCSGRKKKYGNPDKKRCMDFELIFRDKINNCYQLNWEDGPRKNRKYWDYIRISDKGRQILKRCPAATSGYQPFRQQALAEGIAERSDYEFVISCVAYDQDNQTLISCLRSTGIEDFTTVWGSLFEGKAEFRSFTHQQWVDWVRQHDTQGQWKDWLNYIEQRYGY